MHRSTSDEASTIGSIEATSRPFPLPFHLPPSTNSSASFSSNPITVIYLGLESTNSTVVSLDNAHQSLASASESNIEDSQQTSPRQDSDSSGVGIGRNNTFVPSKVKSPHGRNRNLSLLTTSDSLQTELGTGQTVREGLDRGDSRTTISGTHSVSCAAASGGSMSSAAMQAAPQHAQAPNSSASYGTGSSSRHYQQQSPQTRDPQYAQSRGSPSTVPPSSRRAARQQTTSSAATNSPASPEQYYSPSSTATSTMNTSRNQNLPPSTHASPVTPLNATSPSNSRHRNGAQQQFDGPPIPPPRTSSSQRPQGGVPSTAPLSERVAASRQARQHADDQYEQSDREMTYGGEYISGSDRERSRDDTSTAAASAARNRRKVPHSPEGPHRAISTRDSRGQQSSAAIQSRSETTMGSSAGPGTLSREESTVINRVVVTDPQVDIEREQERLAEARPAVSGVDITPITGLGLVGSEGVDDGGRGAGRTRQDHAATSSRRKEIKFGEYMLGQTLGEGEFGKVKLGWKKDGSVQVAIKLIRRENLSSNPSRLPKIYREISILRELSHPNIVRLHEMVETDRHIGIILEYASGGELFDYILKHRYLKDNAARRLFAQLVSGVGYLHKKGIVHRDLKLENLLLDRNRNIIITDFGFANTFDPVDELGDDIEYNLSNRDYVKKMGLDRQRDNGMRRGDLMQTSCGSPCYAAPELVVSDSLYTGRKVDVWSCGVILVSFHPFDGRSKSNLK
jgi:protein-serine/threonine kinase